MIGCLIESHSVFLSLCMCKDIMCVKIIHHTIWLSHYKSFVILIKRMCCFGGFAIGNVNVLTLAIYPVFNYIIHRIIACKCTAVLNVSLSFLLSDFRIRITM
jgi:hypothetical protein